MREAAEVGESRPSRIRYFTDNYKKQRGGGGGGGGEGSVSEADGRRGSNGKGLEGETEAGTES